MTRERLEKAVSKVKTILGTLLTLTVSGTSVASAQMFEREIDTIPVTINGELSSNPFDGGFDSSKPVFVDIDNDDDLDLFVGEENGKTFFYRNDGTKQAFLFNLVSKDYLFYDVGSFCVPTLVDIDSDGDKDMFLGESQGNINYFRNDGSATEPNFVLVTGTYFSIDVGSFSFPTFVDIDADGDYDLFVGEEDGNLNYYRNDGTVTDPNFTLITSNFFSIDVGSVNIPSFVDIDGDNDYDLIIGEFAENINYYRNDGTSTNPNFVLVTENFASISIGFESSVTFADIDDDGDYDMFVGEDDGNINYYDNIGTAAIFDFSLATENLLNLNDVGRYSNPTFADIDNDGDYDLFVGEGSEFNSEGGRTVFYRNNGTAVDPHFELVTERYVEGNIGSRLAPRFVDIDADGDLDLFIGERNGKIKFYENEGTAISPNFVLVTTKWFSIDAGTMSIPAFADIDDDQDFDLFIGELSGNINQYENAGTASSPGLTLVTDNFLSIDVGVQSAPTFVDIDGDQDFDFFAGQRDVKVQYYINDGTPSSGNFSLVSDDFNSIDVGSNSVPTFVDIDDDGDFDLFLGQREGGLVFYRNTSSDAIPPDAPTNLSAIENQNNAELDWDDNLESDLFGYNVYRSDTAGGPYQKITTMPVEISSYTDSMPPDTTLFYVVTALDQSQNESGNSNEASIRPNFILSRASIDFGDVDVGTQMEDTVTVDNTGTGDLRIDSIIRTNGSNDFTLLSPTSFPITVTAVDTPLVVTFRFLPTTAGQQNAIFTFNSNDPVQPVVNVNVDGNGLPQSGVVVTIPDVVAATSSVAQVLVNISGNDVNQILAGSVTFTYDQNVINSPSVSPGALLSSITSFTGTPGQVGFTFANSMPLTGDGTLVVVSFNVIGVPGSITPLDIITTSFNEGAITASLENGILNVINNELVISGNVSYYSSPSKFLADVTLNATGGVTTLTTTGMDGNYSLEVGSGSNLTLTPSYQLSEPEIQQSISAFDCTPILQFVAGFSPDSITGGPLEAGKLIAADVTGDSTVSALDCTPILQFAAGVPEEQRLPSELGLVVFDPPSIQFTNLTTDQLNQDFVGVIRGDVTGNFVPSQTAVQKTETSSLKGKSFDPSTVSQGKRGTIGSTDRLILRSAEIDEIERKLNVPVWVEARDGLLAMMLEMEYDEGNLDYSGIEKAPESEGFQVQINNRTKGMLTIVMAGSKTLENGSVMEIEFGMKGNRLDRNEIESQIHVNKAEINENREAEVIVDLFGDRSGEPSLPRAFTLSQNYPNPFNPSTTISFQIAETDDLQAIPTILKIYDARGRLVKTLMDEKLRPGSYSIHWDGSNDAGRKVSSGIYLYTITAGDFVETKKMLLIK